LSCANIASGERIMCRQAGVQTSYTSCSVVLLILGIYAPNNTRQAISCLPVTYARASSAMQYITRVPNRLVCSALFVGTLRPHPYLSSLRRCSSIHTFTSPV